MRAKELQEDYDGLQSKTLASVAKLLRDTGEPFDRELNAMVLGTRDDLPDLPEFAVWMAESLAWARFALRDGDFFSAAARFLDEGDPELLDEALQFSDRFGVERLRDALAAFGRWFAEMRSSLSDITPDPVHWQALQQRSLQVVETLKKNGELRGVGVWLFPAPFKVMALAHAETWSDASLDPLVMPTGTQVERALWKLHNDRVITIEKKIVLKKKKLASGPTALVDEFTNLWGFQLPQRKLAKAARTSVLHINGALHELGDRGTGTGA